MKVTKHVLAMGSILIGMGIGEANAQQKIQYPVTRMVDTVDDYHGTKVADPYRWLEDDYAEETKAWVVEQNKVTQSYLDKIPFRKAIQKRLSELWNYPRTGAPFKEGDYYYFYKNDGLQNQAVLYRQKELNSPAEEFINPNTLSAAGTAALGNVSFSKDGKFVAYLVSQAGSDWQQAFVMDVATKQILSDKLDWIKFSNLAWRGNGFYYSRYDAPDEQNKLSKKNEFHKVYYHEIGTEQSADKLIYVDPKNPLRNAGVGVSEDERFLILSTTEGTSGTELQYWDMQDPNQTEFKVLIPGFQYNPDVVENLGDKLIVRTNHDAPNYKVVLIDPKNPNKENWKTIIPEQKEVLQGVGTAGGKLFASYLKDASSRMMQYNQKGDLERVIDLPGIGTVSGFGSKSKATEFFYSFTSFVSPGAVYKYDIATGKSTLHTRSEVKFNPEEYETVQEFFTSKDGTRVPVFLSYKKGLKKNGNNPVLLYGYGGFNIPMTPSFSVSNLFFMEQGGIYAVVNLRGGSEYGEAWHEGGMLENKQNVFDDFIGAAEYLIAQKYTQPSKLAIRGGSNGGLLVGASMTQRPELFKVALPAVGVLDMLRFQRFTIGWAWVVEYGSSEKSTQFPYLYKYSPLHNLKAGTKYPATLVTTGDHDDRVVPAHSFKFAAALQKAHAGKDPVLIRIDMQAGHGAGKPTSKIIEEATDVTSFMMYNLGMKMK